MNAIKTILVILVWLPIGCVVAKAVFDTLGAMRVELAGSFVDGWYELLKLKAMIERHAAKKD